MRPAALALVVLALAGIAPGATAQPSPESAPLVQLVDGRRADRLFRVDPRTLRPLSRPIHTFRNGAGAAFSPDGRLLAYGDASSRRSTIHFVDVARWRSLGLARVGRGGPLGLTWPREDRLLAVAGEGFGRQRLLVIDTTTRAVAARRAFRGRWVDGESIPGGYALLLAPDRGIGPGRLLLADSDGGLRTIVLDRIQAGGNEGERRARFLSPAVAVDSETGRAYVVAAGPMLVAEVDLASGRMSYHSIGAQASKGNIETRWRDAAWAGHGHIAVTGERHPRVGRRRLAPGPVPFGVRLIDTRDWSIRTLDPRPSLMQVAGTTILAHGTRWYAGWRRSESSGLLAFDGAGRRAFTRFRGQDVATLGSHGALAYVWVRPTRMLHVIDLRDGRSVSVTRTLPRDIPYLLTPDE